MSIVIKTALDAGIYKSDGGGETRSHYDFATGPLNLIKALRTLREHCQSMTNIYGNRGHAGSWIELDGTRLDLSDAHDVLEADRYESTPMREARRIIERHAA